MVCKLKDVKISRISKTISLRCHVRNGHEIWVAGFGGVFNDINKVGCVTMVMPVEKVRNMIKEKSEIENVVGKIGILYLQKLQQKFQNQR